LGLGFEECGDALLLLSGDRPVDDFSSTSSSYLLNLSDNGTKGSSDEMAFSTISSKAFVCVVDS
jgi:hypothetical protein